jgi:hypothetical protein
MRNRLLTFSALFVAGTVGGPLLSGTALLPALVGGVTGVASNILAADLGTFLDKVANRFQGRDAVLQNDDLSKAVGRAIAAVIAKKSREEQFQDYREPLRRLASRATTDWAELLQSAEFEDEFGIDPLREPYLAQLFAVKPADFAQSKVLTPELWLRVLNRWQQKEPEFIRDPQVMSEVAEYLHNQFPHALREVLKEDFSKGGRAFGAMALDLSGMLLRTLQEQNELLERLTAGDSLAFEELAGRIESEFGNITQLLTELGIQLTGVETRVIERIDAAEKALTNRLKAIQPSAPDRLQRLEDLYEESRTLCIQSFHAVTPNLEDAISLADDFSIGCPPAEFDLSANCVIALTGDFGIGKTLISLRIFQKAIEQAREDLNARIPIYIDTQNYRWTEENSLQKLIQELSNGLGEISSQGALIIIDNLDLLSDEVINQILFRSKIITNKLRNTTIIIAARQIKDTEIKSFFIPELSKEESHNLVNRISKQQCSILTYERWILILKDAIKRPLIALILGNYLGKSETNQVQSTGDLLNWFVEEIIEQARSNTDTCRSAFKGLAKLSINNGGAISISEIFSRPTRQDLKLLLNSRLILENPSNFICFSLPVIADWFGSDALLDDPQIIQELINDSNKIKKWLNSLMIATARFSYKETQHLLTPIIEKYPVIAAKIIKEGSTRFGNQNAPLPSDPAECGYQIRTAMNAWIKGIGSLASHTNLIRQDGKLCPVGVKIDGSRLSVGWYIGAEDLNEIVNLPPDALHPGSQDRSKWFAGSSQRGMEPAWAWRWTLEDLISEIGAKLQIPLPINNQSLIYEAAWRTALAITDPDANKYSIQNIDRIPISTVEQAVESEEKKLKISTYDIPLIGSTGMSFFAYHFDCLKYELRHHLDLGENFFYSPWPVADQPHYSLWKAYTPEQLRLRSEKIFKAALDAYQCLAQTWFKPFLPDFSTASLLPACFVGIIYDAEFIYGEHNDEYPPEFDWCLKPLPQESENQANIFIAREVPDERVKDFPFRCSESFVTELYCPSPVSALVYRWLKEDLEESSWWDSSFGKTPKFD